MNDLQFEVVKVVAAVAAAIASALVSAYLVPYLNNLAKNKKYERLVSFINTAVRAAEQTIRGSHMGEKRYAEVERQVKEWLNGKGMEITQEQITILIESAVYGLNWYRLDDEEEEKEEKKEKRGEPLYAD